ncbi:cation-transporting atpase 4 protein [Rutstroemia sp. NJR-2017a BBW]|nr:cation-transporting atpase 4 protein [Rutstroemia sp. NJR-2017a BBW]
MTFYGDNAGKVSATVITLMVIAYIVYVLRVHTRLRNNAWGIDDWCMTVAVLPFTVLTIACLVGSFKGVGVHEYRLTGDQIVEGLQYFFFFEVFYCASIIPIKLSISFMLMRIATGRKGFIYSIWGISAMFTAMNLIAMFYIIFQCSPVQAAWNTTLKGGKCNPPQYLADIYYATTAVNITTDWFCAILPIPLLWNVQLNRNAKLSVGFILSLGALASLSACVRLVYTVNLTNSTDYLCKYRNPRLTHLDKTHNHITNPSSLVGISDVLIWGYAENGVGMIVGCISTLRPLFRRILNLGGDSTGVSAPHQNTVWPSNIVRPGGRDEEWVALGETDGRGSESKERILGTGNGIAITKTVQQDFEYPDEDLRFGGGSRVS